MSTLPAASRLVAPLPDDPNLSLALFTIRRMGAHGLADAQAAHALFTGFGLRFRRPLLLTRSMLADLAATAARTVAIAPCCCRRITGAEAAMLDLLGPADDPAAFRPIARALLGVEQVDHVLAAAAAVRAAYADAGRPLSA